MHVAFPNHATLQFSKTAQHLHKHTTGGGRRVHVFGQRSKPGIGGNDLLHCLKSRSFKLRLNLSSFQTTKTSPSRRWLNDKEENTSGGNISVRDRKR
jgi:hypothetical protein